MATIKNINGMTIEEKQADGRIATFTWAIRGDYPRVTVYLDENVKGYENMMIIGMTYPGVLTLLNLLSSDLIDDKPEIFQALNVEFDKDGKKTGKKIVSGEFTIFNNDKGERVLTIKDHRGLTASFTFTIDRNWFKSSLDPKKLSMMFVKNYTSTMKTLFGDQLSNMVDKTEKEIPNRNTAQ
jgi:hypothetical protein